MVHAGDPLKVAVLARAERRPAFRRRADRNLRGHRGGGSVAGAAWRCVRDRPRASRHHFPRQHGTGLSRATGGPEPVTLIVSFQQTDSGSHARRASHVARASRRRFADHLLSAAVDLVAKTHQVADRTVLTRGGGSMNRSAVQPGFGTCPGVLVLYHE